LLVDMPMSLATSLELPAGADVLSGWVVVVMERSATGLRVVSVPWTAGDVIATTPLTLHDVLRILPADDLEPSRLGVSLMACTPDGQVFVTKSLDGRSSISTTVILFPNPEARTAYESAPQTSQCFRDAFRAHNLMIQVGLPQRATPEDVAAKQALAARMAELAASAP
jgi:hypothetical protein